MNTTDIETDHQDVPVCPHCGHRHTDAWEWNFGPGVEGDGEFTCDSCNKSFFASRQVKMTYTTSKLEK